MKVCVMSSEYRKGVSKTNNKPYEAFVTEIVYEENNVKKVQTVWISPELVGGVQPQFGDVMNLEFSMRGYLTSVKPILTEKCKLEIYQVGANRN